VLAGGFLHFLFLACPSTVQDAPSVRLSTQISDRQTDALEMPVIPFIGQASKAMHRVLLGTNREYHTGTGTPPKTKDRIKEMMRSIDETRSFLHLHLLTCFSQLKSLHPSPTADTSTVPDTYLHIAHCSTTLYSARGEPHSSPQPIESKNRIESNQFID